MALGLHGHPGAVAADLVVEEQPLERVPALLLRLGGSPAWERAKKAKFVNLGNVQLQLHGQPGTLGAAAQRAAVKVDQRGNAHALVGQAAREMALRQAFATATLVQTRPDGQPGNLGAVAPRAVGEGNPAGNEHALAALAAQES